LNLGSFPPQVIYIHGGNTNAVELRFKFNNPPYWSAGDLFGTLVLSGHGTFTNDCAQEAALAAAVLGTPTAPMPELPTEWLRPNRLAPSPGSSYDSLMTDTNPPGGSDTLLFTIPGAGTLFCRNFSLANLLNPITPPPYFGTNYYNPSNVIVTFQISVDQRNWSPAQATGPLSVTISNTSPNGSILNTFATKITGMNLSGASPQFGNFLMRQSPTKPSLGQHTIRPDPRGYRVSSFFDVFTELSTDNGASWIPADRSMHVSASAPAAAPGTLFISKIPTGGSAMLQWLGPFTVQSSANVQGPYTDISGSTGGSLMNTWPVTFGSKQQFYRLRQ
jgi:hypothetical protein